jgi:DNA-directed RNA polymerase specialized sigma24 family protein
MYMMEAPARPPGQTLAGPLPSGYDAGPTTVWFPGGKAAMADEGSVSRWLGPLRQGDPDAAQELWQRYFLNMAKLARKVLRQRPLRAADEEDVALSAFDSFCRNAEHGRFPQLADRDDLWRLLAVITARKAQRTRRDEERHKRGGRERLAGLGADDVALLAEVAAREPTPELAAQMAEDYQRLLHLLQDDDLRQVAVARMEGHTIDEISAQTGCAPRSVKRKLQLIRTLWEHEGLS